MFLSLEKERQDVTVLKFTKYDIRDFLSLILEEGKSRILDREKVERWKILILYAVDNMRSAYKTADLRSSHKETGLSAFKYYEKDWNNIKKANDIEELSLALEGLCASINFQ